MGFDLSLKSKSTDAVELKPRNRIKEILLKGGKIDIEPKGDLKRTVEVGSNSLYSHQDDKIKFTNYVYHDSKRNSPELEINLKKMLKDIEFICQNIDTVIFKDNTKKLEQVLDHYKADWRNNKIYKVDGDSASIKGRSTNRFRVYLSVDFKPRKFTSYKVIFFDVHHLAIISSYNGKRANVVEAETYQSVRYGKCHIRDYLTAIED